LRGGFEEPFYKAPTESELGEIRFTKDYISSAMHEVAHWCVAGAERRKKDDFDYWYVPDGRNEEQQKVFFEVEVVPQAYELCLSLAGGIQFNISADNLGGKEVSMARFKNEVFQKTEELLDKGLRSRARQFVEALQLKFEKPKPKSLDTALLMKQFKECYRQREY